MAFRQAHPSCGKRSFFAVFRLILNWTGLNLDKIQWNSVIFMMISIPIDRNWSFLNGNRTNFTSDSIEVQRNSLRFDDKVVSQAAPSNQIFNRLEVTSRCSRIPLGFWRNMFQLGRVLLVAMEIWWIIQTEQLRVEWIHFVSVLFHLISCLGFYHIFRTDWIHLLIDSTQSLPSSTCVYVRSD